MICPACGHVNIAGADICASCENSLSVAEQTARSVTPLEHGIQSDPIRVLKPVKPVTVEPTTRLSEVVQLLANHNIGCVLVTFCDALVGIFSERDLLMRVGDRMEELANHPIRHFMTPAPETLTEDDTIAFAVNRMALCDFRHIPIEDQEKPVGIISVRDVLRYAALQFPEVLAPTN